MGVISEKLKMLVGICDELERELVEEMIFDAAAYVRQVVIMESTSANFAGREGERYRNAVEETDKRRSEVHNGLINSVNIVNRLCEKYELEPIYTGGEQRRFYGDFAIELVNEIFVNRA